MLRLLAVLTALCLAALCAGGAQLAAAADAQSTMLLVDGSGSMWGRFESETEKRAKIDVVRDLLKPIVSGAGQTRIGMASFGHRRKGDCSDVEVIAPPGADRTAILGTLEKLNPKGKGPLADALRQTAAAIGPDRPASIVAITDGVDNCRQDACAAAAEIAKTSPGIAIHVVSIGIDPIELPQLQCIAKETGGKFYDVRDSIGLAVSITEATGLAISTAPAAAAGTTHYPAAPTPAQLAGASLRATTILAANAPPLNMPAHWRIEESGSEEPPRHIEAAQVAENLPPGTYDIAVEVSGMTANSQVTIEAGKPVNAALALNAARLAIKVKDREGAGAGAIPLVTVSTRGASGKAGQTVWIGRSDSVDILLPAASYTVAVAEGQTRQERAFDLALGTETAAEFALGTGRIALSALAREGGEALSGVTFAIAEDDPESPDGRRELFRSRATEPEFTLPAGTYYVTARLGSAEVRQRVALSPGANIKKALVIPAALLVISAQVSGAPPADGAGLIYHVYSLEGAAKEVARSTLPRFEGTVNAGKYRVVAALDAHGVWAAQDVVLEAGKAADIVLKIDCAEIAFKPPPADNAIVPGEAFWEIKDTAGRPVWHGTSAEPNVLLAPGRYQVRLEVRDVTVEAAFEVKSGEKRQIELGAK